MQLWSFHRYRRPQLCLDAIEHAHDSRTVTLYCGTQTYRFSFDDADAAAQTAAEIANLRDAGSPLWETVRASEPGSAWHALATFLDTRSLIRETLNEAVTSLARQARRVEDLVSGTHAAIMDRLASVEHAAATAHADRLYRAIDRTLAAGTSFFAGRDPYDAAFQPNFYLGLAAIEFEYLRHASPPALAAVKALLGRVARARSPAADAVATINQAGGLYDQHDLASHLWLIAHCLVQSVSDASARFRATPLPDTSLSSGLEFMRRTELLTRETLSLWGPNRYVTALEALKDAASPLIAGPYIEQYHVTRRFVEIVSPLLSKRLARPLRRLMYQYYSEEVGHEALESTTCEALGVSPRALDAALPLPLHFAFVDALTVAAELDPITSFAAIMVIEGVFGEPPRMSLRLASVGEANPAFRSVSQDHDDLNDTLNHNSIARDCFEHVSAVSPDRQRSAMQRVLFLLELNHRAWDGIAEFYGSQKALMLQGPLGLPMTPQP